MPSTWIESELLGNAMQYRGNSGLTQTQHRPVLSELSARSRDIFRTIVEAYVETGEPVGSRTLSRRLGQLTGGQLSPATMF